MEVIVPLTKYLLATLGVPSITKRMFTEIEQCLGTSFEQLLLELMMKTGREEKQIAEQNKNYHEGVPAITVRSCGWQLEQMVT